MPDKNNTKPYILIEFAETDSVDFKITQNGVNPLMMLTVAEYMGLMTKQEIISSAIEAQKKFEEQQKLIGTQKPEILRPN